MEKRNSISYPELTVMENGDIYLGEKKLSLVFDHGCSTRGPVIGYAYQGKQKQLSAINIIWECWVKNEKITRAELIGQKDGSLHNLHPSNLTRVKRSPKRIEKLSQPSRAESYSSWLNGDTELFC